MTASWPELSGAAFATLTAETAIAAALKDRAGVIDESADVLYHLLVLWIDRGIKPGEVMQRLKAREARSGHAEKATRKRRQAKGGKSR